MATTTALMTFEEFERLPDMVGKRELIQGELLETPPAEVTHNEVADWLFLALHEALKAAHGRGEARELGTVHREMGYLFSKRSWVQPDLSITHAEQARAKYFQGGPAIAIEIISPGNTVDEIESKTDLYFEFGALEIWLVHPKHRRIEIRRPGGKETISSAGVLSTPLLPGLALPVAEILK
jgi:Uma2 family endonuclease